MLKGRKDNLVFVVIAGCLNYSTLLIRISTVVGQGESTSR